jgi:hypothetical protein
MRIHLSKSTPADKNRGFDGYSSAMQIFHPVFLVDNKGNHPEPYSVISVDDVESGKWQVNLAAFHATEVQEGRDPQTYLLSYCRKLKERGKYSLTI